MNSLDKEQKMIIDFLESLLTENNRDILESIKNKTYKVQAVSLGMGIFGSLGDDVYDMYPGSTCMDLNLLSTYKQALVTCGVNDEAKPLNTMYGELFRLKSLLINNIDTTPLPRTSIMTKGLNRIKKTFRNLVGSKAINGKYIGNTVSLNDDATELTIIGTDNELLSVERVFDWSEDNNNWVERG